jgi:hypothetical protein
MKIVMKADTFCDGQNYQRGKTYDVPPVRAEGWLDRGIAALPRAPKAKPAAEISDGATEEHPDAD